VGVPMDEESNIINFLQLEARGVVLVMTGVDHERSKKHRKVHDDMALHQHDPL